MPTLRWRSHRSSVPKRRYRQQLRILLLLSQEDAVESLIIPSQVPDVVIATGFSSSAAGHREHCRALYMVVEAYQVQIACVAPHYACNGNEYTLMLAACEGIWPCRAEHGYDDTLLRPSTGVCYSGHTRWGVKAFDPRDLGQLPAGQFAGSRGRPGPPWPNGAPFRQAKVSKSPLCVHSRLHP